MNSIRPVGNVIRRTNKFSGLPPPRKSDETGLLTVQDSQEAILMGDTKSCGGRAIWSKRLQSVVQVSRPTAKAAFEPSGSHVEGLVRLKKKTSRVCRDIDALVMFSKTSANAHREAFSTFWIRHRLERSELQREEIVRRQNIERYKNEHNIGYEATSDSSLFSILLLGGGAVVLETILNSLAFADASAHGLLGGIYVAAAVSILNVSLAVIAGTPGMRNLNHKSYVMKTIGGLSIAFWIALSALVNIFAGHYRAQAELNPLSASNAAWKSFASNTFAIPSVQGWLLVFVGMLVTVTVALKLYSSDDRYPRYGRFYRHWRRSVVDLRYAREKCLESFEKVCRNALNEWNKSRKSARNLEIKVVECESKLEKMISQLSSTADTASENGAISLEAERRLIDALSLRRKLESSSEKLNEVFDQGEKCFLEIQQNCDAERTKLERFLESVSESS